MDGDGSGADGFEFNLTRVLESLDRRLAASPDPSPIGSPPPFAAPTVALAPDPTEAAPTPPSPPAPAPLPHRVPSQRGSQQTRPAPRPTRLTPDAPEPLPTRTRAATPAAAAAAPPEALPTRTAAPMAAAVAPGRRSMFDEAATGEARAALHRVPVDTNVAVAALDAPLLPTLPPVTATPPPEAATARAAAMPTVADVRQFQNAQRRQARKNREGRVMGRVMLVVVLFAAGVGLALTVGRDYLFPAGWADELATLVPEVEAARGAEFDKVVPLVDQPADEFADTTVVSAVFGPDPARSTAVWRALGIASGEVDSHELGAGLAAANPAVFDVATESIVRVGDVGVGFDLRQPLADALAHQIDGDPRSRGLLGPMPPANLRGADLETAGDQFQGIREVVWQFTEGVVRSSETSRELVPYDANAELIAPLPVQYQVVASAISAIELYRAGITLPADALELAPEAALAAGDTPIEDAVALGIDDWTLVWANRLPAESVATLVAATKGDSLRTFERAGVSCAGAVFESHNELYSAATLNELGRWAAAAPAEAQAAVTAVSSTHVQLTVCDPGTEVAQPLQLGAVEAVVRGQLNRIAVAAAASPTAADESVGSAPDVPAVSVVPSAP